MDRLRSILVGVDFSPCSEAALRQAVRIGAWTHARVAAVNVVPLPVYALPSGMMAPIEFHPVDLLVDSARCRWAEWPPACELGEKVAFDVTLGVPRGELVDRVSRGGYDLLVIGAHSDFDSRRGVGSVAAACVQRAACKVLVVREQQVGSFRSVVACVDFAEASRVALEQAIRIAAQDGSLLHIVHVFSDPWRGIAGADAARLRGSALADRYRAAVEHDLRLFCDPMAHELAALKASFHAMQYDGHGKGVVQFVQQQGCDLVVLGTRARWNIRDFLWGSTAERVVREAGCSALTVKPPGFQAQ